MQESPVTVTTTSSPPRQSSLKRAEGRLPEGMEVGGQGAMGQGGMRLGSAVALESCLNLGMRDGAREVGQCGDRVGLVVEGNTGVLGLGFSMGREEGVPGAEPSGDDRAVLEDGELSEVEMAAVKSGDNLSAAGTQNGRTLSHNGLHASDALYRQQLDTLPSYFRSTNLASTDAECLRNTSQTSAVLSSKLPSRHGSGDKPTHYPARLGGRNKASLFTGTGPVPETEGEEVDDMEHLLTILGEEAEGLSIASPPVLDLGTVTLDDIDEGKNGECTETVTESDTSDSDRVTDDGNSEYESGDEEEQIGPTNQILNDEPAQQTLNGNSGVSPVQGPETLIQVSDQLDPLVAESDNDSALDDMLGKKGGVQEHELPQRRTAARKNEFPLARAYRELTSKTVPLDTLNPAATIKSVFPPYNAVLDSSAVQGALGLDQNTELFDSNGKPVGVISDVVGKFSDPNYVMDLAEDASVEVGQALFYVSGAACTRLLTAASLRARKQRTLQESGPDDDDPDDSGLSDVNTDDERPSVCDAGNAQRSSKTLREPPSRGGLARVSQRGRAMRGRRGNSHVPRNLPRSSDTNTSGRHYGEFYAQNLPVGVPSPENIMPRSQWTPPLPHANGAMGGQGGFRPNEGYHNRGAGLNFTPGSRGRVGTAHDQGFQRGDIQRWQDRHRERGRRRGRGQGRRYPSGHVEFLASQSEDTSSQFEDNRQPSHRYYHHPILPSENYRWPGNVEAGPGPKRDWPGHLYNPNRGFPYNPPVATPPQPHSIVGLPPVPALATAAPQRTAQAANPRAADLMAQLMQSDPRQQQEFLGMLAMFSTNAGGQNGSPVPNRYPPHRG